jgi:hypothetical protein
MGSSAKAEGRRTALVERLAKVLDLTVVPVVGLIKRDVPEEDSAERGEGPLVGPVEDGPEHRAVLVGEFVLACAVDELGPPGAFGEEVVVEPGRAEQEVLKRRVAVSEERLEIEARDREGDQVGAVGEDFDGREQDLARVLVDPERSNLGADLAEDRENEVVRLGLGQGSR